MQYDNVRSFCLFTSTLYLPIPGSCYIKQWTDTAFIEMYTETIIFYLSYLQLLIMRSNLGMKTINGALKWIYLHLNYINLSTLYIY